MDLSCIISSGDLELYVLGLLSKEDAYKIEQLALLFPEVKDELDRISLSLEALALTAVATPSPAVKAGFMEKIKALKAEEEERPKPIQHKEPAPVIAMQSKRDFKPFLLAASVIGLVLSIGAVIYLSQQNKQATQQVTALQQKVTVLQDSSTLQQQQLQASVQALQLWQNADFKKINLTNVPGKPDALAQVFWNPKTTEVYLTDISLPPTPAGKQYQLWAIVEGKPVDAGMLQYEKQLAQKMKAFETADAFAITLENKGGSPTPTMEALYVMAKVS